MVTKILRTLWSYDVVVFRLNYILTKADGCGEKMDLFVQYDTSLRDLSVMFIEQ